MSGYEEIEYLRSFVDGADAPSEERWMAHRRLDWLLLKVKERDALSQWFDEDTQQRLAA